jgi:hypothetical protein
MAKWLKVLILGVIGIGALGFAWEVLMGHNNRESAEALEQEVRAQLPVGSSLATVEGFLEKRGIEFSYQAPAKTLYAAARKLKGSTMITQHDLTLKFHFDDSSRLESIDTKAAYTGP